MGRIMSAQEGALSTTSALTAAPRTFAEAIDVIEEASSVVFVEDSSETPWVLLEGLNVLNFNEENIARLGSFDLEWARQIMDTS